jgi:hypothetical protein
MPTASSPQTLLLPESTAEAIIIVKAAPQLGDKHGETVCTAGITRDGQWVRLYPIAFRTLDQAQQFKRWDIVKYAWRRPKDDQRPSRRVEHQSLRIAGTVPPAQRFGLVDLMQKDSLSVERAAGKSFAFIRPKIRKFLVEKKTDAQYREEEAAFALFAKQDNLFLKPLVPYKPCRFVFKYEYQIADGKRTGTCQDWETEATYFNWVKLYGEQDALKRMQQRWGEEMPDKGMLFAMGTHSRWPDTWLINGIIQMSDFGQLSLGL